MGLAIMEYLDASIADLYEAGAGTTYTTSANMSYNDVVKALAKMENVNWVVDSANPPFLIVSPDSAAQMLQDTQFLDSKRYTLYDLGRMMEGEIGQYGGCRVLKTSLLAGTSVGSTPSDPSQGVDAFAYIVFPNDTGLGPVTLLAWKRRLETRNFYWTQWAYTYYVSSVRAKPVLVQATGVCKITIAKTP
jgi:N4-gp56 family major capsid protein